MCLGPWRKLKPAWQAVTRPSRPPLAPRRASCDVILPMAPQQQEAVLSNQILELTLDSTKAITAFPREDSILLTCEITSLTLTLLK